jgi:hypothetical protein
LYLCPAPVILSFTLDEVLLPKPTAVTFGHAGTSSITILSIAISPVKVVAFLASNYN